MGVAESEHIKRLHLYFQIVIQIEAPKCNKRRLTSSS